MRKAVKFVVGTAQRKLWIGVAWVIRGARKERKRRMAFHATHRWGDIPVKEYKTEQTNKSGCAWQRGRLRERERRFTKLCGQRRRRGRARACPPRGGGPLEMSRCDAAAMCGHVAVGGDGGVLSSCAGLVRADVSRKCWKRKLGQSFLDRSLR
ncbi:hypothetical protein ACLOJK_020129 [Asimina triloba]